MLLSLHLSSLKTRLVPVAGIIAVSCIALAQQPHRVDDAVLKNIPKSSGEEWLSYGYSQQETRYSPLKQIDAGNVSRLGLAWSYDIGQGGGNQEGTPLMWNGTVYGITNWSIVYAVDARTGKEKWRWDPEVNKDIIRTRACCGVVNRGIAIYNGRIIAPIIDGRLEALDAETGKPVWETRVGYAQEYYTLTMAPRIAKGKVIIGAAGSEFPVRGFFSAFDANTGAFAWKFYTVPGDPSKGFENEALKKAAETWSGEWWKLGGGGSVWDGMAYDPEADLFYVGTGNGGPWPEELRHSKGKDNLYVASILAVKPDTGKLVWYFQPVPGDSWDYDSVQQLLLADITIKGKPRKVIMQANKDGFYYVIDRVTGQFISGQPFVQENWAKGLDEVTGRPILNPEAKYGADTVSITPGPGGGHNWAPMSFNPNTGLVYIPASTFGSMNYAVDPNFTYKQGQSNLGIAGMGRGGRGGGPPPPPDPNAKKPITPPMIGPKFEEGQRKALVAWDPVTQTMRWHAPEGGSIGGGTVTTAGNLVIQVSPQGHLLAYSADKGENLLDVDTGLVGGMGPPITYMIDGKQYIALAGGTGHVLPRNGDIAPPPPPAGTAAPAAGAAAPAAGAEAPPPDDGPFTPSGHAPKLLVYVLDGKAESSAK